MDFLLFFLGFSLGLPISAEVVTPYKGQVRVLRKIMHLQNGLKVPQDGPVADVELVSLDET